MRDIMVIKNAKVAKLLADKTRRQILTLLKIRKMSVSQLAKVLDKPASSIDHHIKCLKAAGLVEPAGERRRGNLIERLYKASARHYVVSYVLSEEENGSHFRDWDKKIAEEAVSALDSFGYKALDKARAAELFNDFAALTRTTLELLASRQTKPSYLKPYASFLLVNALMHLELYRNEKFLKLMRELSSLTVRDGDD